VSHEHGVPVVPMFWIEGEDHDWDEVRSCSVLDSELVPRSVALPARSGSEPVPIARIPLDEAVLDTLAALETAMAPTDFRSSVMAELRKAYHPGRGMAEAFGRWLESVLGGRGLVVYDASDPSSKRLVADIFQRELSTAGQTSKLAAQAG